MKIVLQVSGEMGTVKIDGRELFIRSGEPFEVPVLTGTDFDAAGYRQYTIPEEYACREILHNLWYLGIVEVPFVREGFQIKMDEAGAVALAKKAFIAAQEKIVADYVRTQQERVQQGSPANPPNGRAAAIISMRGIDIKREYGLNPAGHGHVAAAASLEESLTAQFAERMKAMEAVYEAKLAQILAAATAKPEGGGKQKAS